MKALHKFLNEKKFDFELKLFEVYFKFMKNYSKVRILNQKVIEKC
jgi:hypothetical protein